MNSFRAMGTDVSVVAPQLSDADYSELCEAVASEFASNEAIFLRFLCDSELTRLNTAHGNCSVSNAMFETLLCAKQYYQLTHGIFDSTIANDLVALGYDQSFEPGRLDRSATHHQAIGLPFGFDQV